MASDRDPRVDPRRGDVTEGSMGTQFRVVARTAQSVTFQSRYAGHDWGDHLARWSLKNWRAYAKYDVVVEVADGE